MMTKEQLRIHHQGHLVGYHVPFWIGIPSVTALVIGIVGDSYVLQQDYDTHDERGEWIHVTKTYYRGREFINSYWLDIHRDGC